MQGTEPAFLEWLNASGFKVNTKIGIQTFADTGRGVVALADIDEDEVLFTVPRDYLLAAKRSAVHTVAGEDEADDSDWKPLLLTLLYEYTLPTSRWRPYLDVLPRDLPLPVFWNEDELRELKGTGIEDKLGIEQIKTQFEEELQPLLEAHPEFFNAQHTFDLYRWLGAIVMSYSFVDEERDGICMVPMADMFNASIVKNNAKLFFDSEDLEMRSVKSIPAGEEVFNTYGDLSNAELLWRYGYIENGNPCEDVEFALEQLVEVLGKLETEGKLRKGTARRIEALQEADILEDDTFAVGEDLEIPGNLLGTVCGALADDATITAIVQGKRDADDLPTLVTPALRARVLAKLVEARLALFDTTLEADMTRASEALPERQRMAITVRIKQKDILTRLLAKLKAEAKAEGKPSAAATGGGAGAKKSGTKRKSEEQGGGSSKKVPK